MDPMTIISGLGLGFSALGALANLIPTKADIERNKRIKELKGLEEADALGLTEKQRQELQVIGMEPIQASMRETRARAPEMVGAAELGAGGSLIRQEAQQEGVREATRQLGQQLTQLDREQAKIQKQELENLKAQKEQRTAQRIEGGIQTAEDLLVGAAQVAASAEQAKMQGLLKGNEQALRNSIAASIESGNAYVVNKYGEEVINPIMERQLIAFGLSPNQVEVVKYMPREQLMAWFKNWNPTGVGTFTPVPWANPFPSRPYGF